KTLIVGDSQGRLSGWFRIREVNSPNRDGSTLVRAHDFPASGSPVARLAPSSTNQTFAAAFADGTLSVFHMTTDRLVVGADLHASDAKPETTSVSALALGADGSKPVLLAATAGELRGWRLTAPHPEVSAKGLLGQVWYESYPRPEFVWQSSGGEGYEPKYSLIPLIFGTLKATFYSLLFGVPIALMAAIYTSEFLTPRAKALVKPSIELMASLPSVVLGFLGGLVLAPLVDQNLGFTLAMLATVPLTLLTGAFLWQLLPYKLGLELAPYRFLVILLIAPIGLWLAWLAGPELESLLFDGNLKGWLRGPSGENYHSTIGAWLFLLAPISAAACATFIALVVNPWQREQVHHWTRNGCAWFELFKFIGGAAITLGLALAVGATLDALGLDPRGTAEPGSQPYDQRNALIVGFVMGFAIIPLIYTISEDALAAVPEHLRSASLGAGATPWQTAVRIIIPTAMSGLFSAVMIGLGRAVGETMIVLMATGNTPIMDFDVFNGFRTLSASLAEELPESVPGTTHYRILFLAGLTLFVTTFIINTIAEYVRMRFRRRSYGV
ncbi:MAG TPA: ABC transporter permease subunit, partial [Pirellulales bacterium]